jgi:hypothetical protein
MYSNHPLAVESRARRAAKRVGLIARKDRARRTRDFVLVDASSKAILVGLWGHLSAEDVITICYRLREARWRLTRRYERRARNMWFDDCRRRQLLN